MRASKTNSDHQNEVDVTPLLDVVFIILIFFIVTASFVRESGLALNQPEPDAAKSSQPSIVLKIDRAGGYRLQSRAIDLRAIKSSVLRLTAENPKAVVTVKVHNRAKTQSLASAIDQLRSAQVFNPPISLIEI